MPSTDTSDLAETTMGLARKAGDTPTGNHTLTTVTAGDSAHIDQLVLSEDAVHADLSLEQGASEVHLSGDITTVDLDLEDVSLALAKLELADLGVSNDAHNLAVLLDLVQLELNEIGRASCRDRVCQYVSISVVAV